VWWAWRDSNSQGLLRTYLKRVRLPISPHALFWISEVRIQKSDFEIESDIQNLISEIRYERETGIEPATFCLGSKHSTVELLPPTKICGLEGN
jgi:hypothetical protein